MTPTSLLLVRIQVETGPRSVQVAGEWQNATGFDLDDDHQDLGDLAGEEQVNLVPSMIAGGHPLRLRASTPWLPEMLSCSAQFAFLANITALLCPIHVTGWSTAELEMLRGIADFADDVVCTAGSAEDLSQPAAASPGSAATMAAPASPSACSDLLQGRGRSGDMVPGMPVPVAECGQYRGPDCGQYKAVDGYHPEPSWKEEPREAAPVGYQVGACLHAATQRMCQ